MSLPPVVITCAGESFDVKDWTRLRQLGHSLVINYAHIPIRRTYQDTLLPTYAFAADRPRKCLPAQWINHPDVATVTADNRSRSILKHQDSRNNLTWHWKPNPDWDQDPFNPDLIRKDDRRLGPYKSVLLAIQWLYRQGYRTIYLYGVDLTNPGTYGGVPEFRAKEFGKYRSHSVEAFVLYWYAIHARKHNLNLINLSQSSLVRDFLQTRTIDECLDDRLPPAIPPVPRA